MAYKVMIYTYIYIYIYMRGGADKSLSRLGRKNATATKLDIYSARKYNCNLNLRRVCATIVAEEKK